MKLKESRNTIWKYDNILSNGKNISLRKIYKNSLRIWTTIKTLLETEKKTNKKIHNIYESESSEIVDWVSKILFNKEELIVS